jgi:uncharacterized protein YbaR (Trm112 family)
MRARGQVRRSVETAGSVRITSPIAVSRITRIDRGVIARIMHARAPVRLAPTLTGSLGGVSLTLAMIDKEFLDILACPVCKTPVTLVKEGTALKCGQCHRVYPIRDDIPVMLIDQATIEPPAGGR